MQETCRPAAENLRFHSLRLLPVVVFEYCGYSGSSTIGSHCDVSSAATASSVNGCQYRMATKQRASWPSAQSRFSSARAWRSVLRRIGENPLITVMVCDFAGAGDGNELGERLAPEAGQGEIDDVRVAKK